MLVVEDLISKVKDQGMLATAEDVGIFLRALNMMVHYLMKGNKKYILRFTCTNTQGLIVGYQSIARIPQRHQHSCYSI